VKLSKDFPMDQLSEQIKQWGRHLGFQQIGITDTDLSAYETKFYAWLAKSYHGSMSYMSQHGTKRTRPQELIPGTVRVISARMDYFPPDTDAAALLKKPQKGYISRYALGRDYHKVMRKRLKQLANKIEAVAAPLGYRAFCDSAPVLEKPLAEKANLGWIGKHTNLINKRAGSWFFLGEIYTNLPLTIDAPHKTSHCGSCTACIDICPTQAIVAPYQLDARRCISYLTIESHEPIPLVLRPLLGNRIYGCDDCQLICPWNKFASYTKEQDFLPRHGLASPELLTLFAWSEQEFLQKTEGSPIRRIGHEKWLRNIAVALGNAPFNLEIVQALQIKLQEENLSTMVKEHIAWAHAQQLQKRPYAGSLAAGTNKCSR
jgi:epoxyqueuosine reductase